MTFMRTDAHTLSRSVRIAAPLVKVWELITTVARITDWYDTWDVVEHAADERLQVGTSFRLIRHGIGRNESALCYVTLVEPLKRLCWLQHAPQQPLMLVEFQLVSLTEGATGTWLNHTRSIIKPADR